jgi:hypothetical protein
MSTKRGKGAQTILPWRGESYFKMGVWYLFGNGSTKPKMISGGPSWAKTKP